MEVQLERYGDELERVVVELDTVRGSLLSVSASNDVGNQQRLADAGARAARRDELDRRRRQRGVRLSVDADVVAWRRHLHRHPELSFERARDGGVRGRDARRVRPGRRAADRDERDGAARRRAAGRRAAGRHRRAAGRRGERRRVRLRDARAECTPAGTTGTRRCCSARRACCPSAACRRGEVRFLFQHGEELAPGGAREHGRRGRHGRRRLRLRLPPVGASGARARRRGPRPVHGRSGLLPDHDHRARRPRRAPPHRGRHDRRGRRGRRLAPARRGAPHRPARAGRGHDRQPPRGRRAERDPGTRRADRHGALVRRGRARADPAADRGDRARRVRGARRGVLARLHVRLPAGRQ